MAADVMCFIPCCKSKDGERTLLDIPPSWLDTAHFDVSNLLHGRSQMVSALDSNPQTIPALELYTGNFYSRINKRNVISLIQQNRLKLFIISAGYGIVDAIEPIRRYEAKMEGPVARYWKEHKLEDIITKIVLSYSPNRIFGFFAGDATWQGNSAKYRYFFSEGVKKAINNGLKVTDAGCFYREEGRGTTAILSSLGVWFMKALASDFSKEIIYEAEIRGLRTSEYPSTLIRFDRLNRPVQK